MTLFTKGLILAATPLAFQAAFVALLWWDHRRAERIEEEDVKYRLLLEKIGAIHTALLDVETGLRGYALTQDVSFRHPLKEAGADLPGHLDQLHDYAQELKLKLNTEIIGRTSLIYLAWARQTSRLVEAEDPATAVQAIKEGTGKRQMDRLRNDLETLRSAIDTQRNALRRDLRDQRGRRLVWLAGSAAGAVLLSLFLGLFFSRKIFAQVRTLEENTHRLVRGEPLLAPIPGQDEIARLADAFQDMARRLNEAREEQCRAEARFRATFHQAPIPMILHAEDGLVLEVNRSWLDSSGYSREEIPTIRDWTEKAYGTSGAEPVRSVIRALYDLAEPKRVGEFEVRTRAGNLRIWDFCTAPMGRTRDGLRMVLTAAVDVTPRKDAEQRLLALNQDLEQRVARRTMELGRANLELRHKNQEVEAFVFGVSHDLRSPLVNLQGFSKELGLACADLRALLIRPEVPAAVRAAALRLLDDDVAPSLRFIETGVLRLAAIIDSLLRLSRAGRVETRREPVDANRIVRRVVDALQDTIRKRAAQVHLAPLPTLTSDPTVLEQVFANLIGNALNYLDPARPGRIEVAARENGPEEWVFAVADNGRGIPEDCRDKVFEAFRRLHPQAAPGEGMGLAIVRRLVHRLQGRVWVESAEGVGSTFQVALPRAPAPPLLPDEGETHDH